ncbi:MAG: DinB family protein [Bacteroidota bacterium]
MKELLLKQIQFEHWANTTLLASMKTANPLDARALFLFSHILSASHMWLSRVNGTPITTALFQERDLAECETLIHENTKNWIEYINKTDEAEFKKILEFILPVDGSQRRIRVQDGILHVVHHSSYHRGQIVTKLKGTVETLPLVTYIIYAIENID